MQWQRPPSSRGRGPAGALRRHPFPRRLRRQGQRPKGGPLTAFEKLCDDAVGDYLAGAQSVPFGEAPLVSYLAARETEYTNLRILLMGRAAGIDRR